MPFRQAAIDLCRGRAVAAMAARVDTAQAAQFEGDTLLDLAAHLFAVASRLLLDDPSIGRGKPESPAVKTLAPSPNFGVLLQQLATLPLTTSAPALYEHIVAALVAIEHDLCRDLTTAAALRTFTDVETIEADGRTHLGGRVMHWIGPRSELAELRERRMHRPGWKPQAPAPHPASGLRQLGLYWRAGDDQPQVESLPLPPATGLLVWESGKAAVKGSFKLALCPLEGAFHPRFEIDNQGFRACRPDGIVQPTRLHDHLTKVVEAAREAKVHLLVLPELMVDTEARNVLSSLLRHVPLDRTEVLPYGVVAGSFHVWDGGAPEAEDRAAPNAACRPRNQAVILDQGGNRIAVHDKRGHFRFPAKLVQLAPQFFEKVAVPLAPTAEIREDIAPGNRLQVLHTSLGKLVLLICADASFKDHQGFVPTIQSLRPDLVVVVSMSSDTRPFEPFLEDMRGFGIGTVFLNAHCICSAPGTDLALCDFAMYEPQGFPVTRLRWTIDEPPLWCRIYHSQDGNENWRPLADPRRRDFHGWSWKTKGSAW